MGIKTAIYGSIAKVLCLLKPVSMKQGCVHHFSAKLENLQLLFLVFTSNGRRLCIQKQLRDLPFFQTAKLTGVSTTSGGSYTEGNSCIFAYHYY